MMTAMGAFAALQAARDAAHLTDLLHSREMDIAHLEAELRRRREAER